MALLPAAMVACLNHVAPLFSRWTWRHVPILVVGALLTPGQRMVSSALHAVGLAQTPTFQTSHRVLNRAVWSSLGASRILLRLLVATFIVDNEPLVLGVDETIERRRGKKIAAAGIYRDPVRSSHCHARQSERFALGLSDAARAHSLGWSRVGVALSYSTRPVRTRCARAPPSSQISSDPGAPTDSSRIRQVHRWLPERQLVVVGDRGSAALELLAAVRPVATFVTRLRLDAHLCAPPPPRAPGQTGRPRLVGKRLPTLEQWRDDPATQWTLLTIPRWESEAQRQVEIVSQTAIWYHTGLPPVPIRWAPFG